jgi:transcriptional regulator with XRE-family HTH domain
MRNNNVEEEQNNYTSIPNCLRKQRRIAGLTQKQVAVVLGVRNTGMISRWENGSRFPNPVNIFRLSALYNTMADALYFDLVLALRKEIQLRRRRLDTQPQGGRYGGDGSSTHPAL